MAKAVCFAFPIILIVMLFSEKQVTAVANTSDVYLYTRPEIEANFLAWVARVGLTAEGSLRAEPAETNQVKAQAQTIFVDQGGTRGFKTVQAAVNSIPDGNNQRVTIQISAGTYSEKVNIPSSKPFITLQGAGGGSTTISWGDTASSSGSTFSSATVAINSDNFIANDIGFANTAPAPPPGAEGRQAVALRITGDKAAFYRCNFYGAQDTLYDDKGRHYFSNCFIQGSIDFIFGDGLSMYKGCELHSIASTIGSLTAQKRGSGGEDTGFSFVNCKVTGSGVLYLGRAWGPYSRVVYSFTYIDNIITPGGWNDFGIANRQQTVFYGQYKCSGPGSAENNRVTWSHELTDAQAAPFQSISFIQGQQWLQST
ncbi:hypothetical protein O6H91_04G106500 [Diphasiastrum complanatum]|uniref:Uncharacterized protein n=2 Tax=Diphasiastrum complanatum TaxID=34168 RepID=A0ACC2E0V4_DIPCM|nr:hypothetical protein O6H91_04G104700 [Diphasiastrum complanatum]KAJ7559911.1 hypothetical protein O6H91_04G106500 [Diphasiastrum complanatum]